MRQIQTTETTPLLVSPSGAFQRGRVWSSLELDGTNSNSQSPRLDMCSTPEQTAEGNLLDKTVSVR